MASSQTIGSGETYTTFSAFEAANLSTDDWTCNVKGAVSMGAASIVINNAAFTTLKITNNGDFSPTNINGGDRLELSGGTSSRAIGIDANVDVDIEDLEIDGNGQDVVEIIRVANGEEGNIRRCVIHNLNSARSSGILALRRSGTATKMRVESCLIFDFTNSGSGDVNGIYMVAAPNASGWAIAENNTITGLSSTHSTANAYGINMIDDAESTLYNNLVTDITVSGSGSALCYTNSAKVNMSSGGNLSDDTSSPESALRSKTITFENAAGNDYRLASGDTDAIGQGDASGTEPNDITNAARGTPSDIGAFEYVAAASGVKGTIFRTNLFGNTP